MRLQLSHLLVLVVAAAATLDAAAQEPGSAAAPKTALHKPNAAAASTSSDIKFNGNAVVSSIIHLPNGSKAKSMAFGNGTDLFISTLAGEVFHTTTAGSGSSGSGGGVPPTTLAREPGIALTGVAYDARQHALFVAGSVSGKAYVYFLTAARPYAVAERVALPLSRLRGWQTPYVNDVVIGRDEVYFTDSFAPLVHVAPRVRAALVAASAAAAAGAAAPPGVGFYRLGGGWRATAARLNANGLIFADASRRALLVSNFDGGYVARVDLPPGPPAVGRAANATVLATLPAFRAGARDPWPNVRPDCMVAGEAEGVVYLSDNFEDR
jgi:hypothetical protein